MYRRTPTLSAALRIAFRSAASPLKHGQCALLSNSQSQTRDVFWLEGFEPPGSEVAEARALRLFRERMERFGLGDKSIVYRRRPSVSRDALEVLGSEQLLSVMLRSDLLLNFDYSIEPELLHSFDLTALVDIDPGLLQLWVSTGQLTVQDHDLYLTTGETVGRSERISDLGKDWIHFRPPVSVRLWPYTFDPEASTLTTVSGWWGGGGKGERTDGVELFFENNKRVSFLEMLELPQLTDQRLELALALGEGRRVHQPPPRSNRGLETPHVGSPSADRLRVRWCRPCPTPEQRLERSSRRKRRRWSWRIPELHPAVARRVQLCQAILHVLPECLDQRPNGMLSGTGKPAIVPDTGPSTFLPSGEGIFRFSDLEGALAGIEALNANYEEHCEAARELAGTSFDAPLVLDPLLDRIFSGAAS